MSNIATLRAYLKKQNLDGLIIPRTDEYQSEYLAPYAERMAWLTGFTGSAGVSIITQDHAAMFVDGRYTIQVQQQTDNSLFDYQPLKDETIKDWISIHLKAGTRLAYDPALHTHKTLALYCDTCKSIDVQLTPVLKNPIDQCWQDQPPRPASDAIAHPMRYSGETSLSKCQRLAKQLHDDNVAALVISMPECVAWLLNMRGSDSRLVPLVLSRAILYADGRVDWCFDKNRVTFSINEHCGEFVQLISETEFEERLVSLAKADKKVMVDETSLPEKHYALLEQHSANFIFDNPIQLAKACKNTVEIDNAHNAHLRDGVAWARLLHWIETNIDNTTISELTVSDKLRSLREENDTFRGDSFDSAASFGENAALCHYAPSEATNKVLEKNNLFLLDAGAQYLEGTTDTTRTIALNEATAEQKTRFTQVLKGHISLSSCRFPEGTKGHQLDAFARRALWDAGLDYAHGTGHGVGSFLSVHEGPQSISLRPNNVALQAGMLLSNEPGFYKDGEYGIRIENVVEVKTSEKYPGFLAFENLTVVPISLDLIDVDMLSQSDIDWLNTYHKTVFDKVAPHLADSQVVQWLKEATRQLS